MQAPAVFSLLLNLDKKIIRVLQNDFHFLPSINPGSSIYSLFDTSLKPELESFWQQLILRKAITGYTIGRIGSSTNSFCLNGMVHNNDVWLIASKPCSLTNEYLSTATESAPILFSPECINLQQENNIISESEIFNNDIAHALEEPIRMITGFMTLLKSRYAGSLDEKAGSFFDFAIDGGRRLQKMMAELISLAAIGKNKKAKESVDLNSLLREVLQNMSHQVTETKAQILLPDTGIILYGYRAELGRLLQELLDNAIKFRHNDRSLRITVECQHHAHYNIIKITDNGIGIPDYAHETIFALFKKLHASTAYSGNGLGLAFCKKIVTLHGGCIRVESKPGEGSRFSVKLPCKPVNH